MACRASGIVASSLSRCAGAVDDSRHRPGQRLARLFRLATRTAAPAVSAEVGVFTSPVNAAMPRVVETDWLEARLGTLGLKVIDLRPQPEYNAAHIPASSASMSRVSAATSGSAVCAPATPHACRQFRSWGCSPQTPSSSCPVISCTTPPWPAWRLSGWDTWITPC